ncbi:methylated-DNA--[protein]-cysteine S-methyltransferase [Neisseria sp. MVDL19-042950]|uniref:methylated-DNA--[protein]-cysteine S-methyltransferase n=1 Tax=Neisseria sp. MVDL19-042950 TaxID=3061169 RepID=UPI00265D94FC|nr:methylated-DNA--[protein]-cysteine S-methyltransferase [Neisseria sp. MVDL19-042950]MDO1508852.1 methylated-DNA--[protein]-cysteine S-methyltransferase [Neisseria sp. MVDL19-042950]
MNIRRLPDPQTLLPVRWQAYAAWPAARENPPESYRDHPLESADELVMLKKDFERYVGISLGQYVCLKRITYLLAQRNSKHDNELTVSVQATPLGQMLAVFSTQGLCLLEFPERKIIESELLAVQKAFQADFVWRDTVHSQTLQQELNLYFEGRLKNFATPLDPVGTPFQRQVWRALQSIPYGETRSYKQQAERIGKPQAVRAVAAANGQNKISILIPCHRVIGSNGDLTGYGGGLARKKALLELEGAMPV